MADLIFSDEIIIEQQETFPRQTIRNRFEIATSQGRLRLSVPLAGRKNSTLTKDVRISSDDTWKIQHWRSIYTAYGSSPYFIHYEEVVHSILYDTSLLLVDYNNNALKRILKLIKADKTYSFSSEYLRSYKDALDKRNFQVMPSMPSYMQVFEDRIEFLPDLSILDLLFNQGPASFNYLQSLYERSLNV